MPVTSPTGCKPDVPCITPGMYAFLGAAAALGGIMHLTVCVVVIMFELTGALTYILPTMITLMITKTIGDFFGKGGIADQMIRLNGYPFLHKEEYSFGVSVGEVMQKDLMVMTSGQRLDEIDQILLEKNYQGFPVVKNKESMILVGYIGRSELKYVIDKAKRIHGISNDAQCFFNLEGANSNIDGNDISQSSSSFIDFGSFIDETPMSVHPRLPLETVVDLFRKMGPRVILIEYIGKLVGLITVKDVLKYIAKREEAEELETIIPDASQTSYSDDDGLELVSRNSRKQGLSLLEMGRLQTSEDS